MVDLAKSPFSMMPAVQVALGIYLWFEPNMADWSSRIWPLRSPSQSGPTVCWGMFFLTVGPDRLGGKPAKADPILASLQQNPVRTFSPANGLPATGNRR